MLVEPLGSFVSNGARCCPVNGKVRFKLRSVYVYMVSNISDIAGCALTRTVMNGFGSAL